MKRVGFKQKARKLLKRGKLNKRSDMPISLLQRKIWELCRAIIRKTYPNSCYTCLRSGLSGSNWQTGHLWAKASLGAFLKYDLRVLRPQCYNCNINQGGRGADFYTRLVKDEGNDYMEKLDRDRKITTNAYDHYRYIFEKYTILLQELQKNSKIQ